MMREGVVNFVSQSYRRKCRGVLCSPSSKSASNRFCSFDFERRRSKQATQGKLSGPSSRLCAGSFSLVEGIASIARRLPVSCR
jgi:hypothetical protein